MQQPGNVLHGKLRPVNLIHLRINGKMECRCQIRTIQYSVVKHRFTQVAILKKGIGQVRFYQIDLFHFTVFKAGVFYFQPVKGGKVKYAGFKIERKQKWVAVVEMQPQQFTVFKFHVSERCIF